MAKLRVPLDPDDRVVAAFPLRDHIFIITAEGRIWPLAFAYSETDGLPEFKNVGGNLRNWRFA